jgi:uncharacterized protein YbjT (DUF2867 family)
MNLLLTGATGNVGKEVIASFEEIESSVRIFAGVSNIERAKSKLQYFPIEEYRRIDFKDSSTFNTALKNIDIVFLLRPPHLADINTVFVPFLESMKQKGIRKIVFLSVQGVEAQKKIPHYKMEQAILEFGFEYIFLRPSYFMQNLTTTLLHEIKTENRIFIPAGKLKMNWVDAKDIGLVGACVLNEYDTYKNSEIEITGSEYTGFKEVAEILSKELGTSINYVSPNLIKFFYQKRKQGVKSAMIFVMIMLHYVPRFSKNKMRLVDTVKEITGKQPGKLIDFIKREKTLFLS